MPTAERGLLDACAAAMREERESLKVVGDGNRWVSLSRSPNEPFDYFPTEAACRAYIDRRAFAAGVRVLAESEPTGSMVDDTMAAVHYGIDYRFIIGIWTSMLGALLAGGDDA